MKDVIISYHYFPINKKSQNRIIKKGEEPIKKIIANFKTWEDDERIIGLYGFWQTEPLKEMKVE